jgi:hypothetical protein
MKRKYNINQESTEKIKGLWGNRYSIIIVLRGTGRKKLNQTQ